MLALTLALSLAAAGPASGSAPAAHDHAADDATGAKPVPAVNLAAALPPYTPRLVPPLDPGPFGLAEVTGAVAGLALADLAIALAGWSTLQLFADDTISPDARNFRRAAYALGIAGLLLPPLGATLIGNWASPGPRGSLVRGFLVGVLAQAAAAFAGLAAAPHYWVILPAQVVAVTVATTLGLHWRRAPRVESDRDPVPLEPRAGRPAPLARGLFGTCPIG